MDWLASLNPQQVQAVTAGDGPILVIAGPGSGKTRVLTHRIAYLLHARGVRPWEIMAVTFTNKAAREMQERLQSLLGPSAINGMSLGTFHALCARILRREAGYLPLDSNFVIFDADDQERVVKNAIRDLNLDEKSYRPAVIHAAISRAKNELLFPDDYPTQNYRDQVIQRIYRRYQEMLRQSNAVDFDDLLLWMAYLLSEYPEVREKYAQRFRHILVDEFQDTNLAQYTLLRHLASVHRNLFAVGDPDQSIYRWRGADYRNIRRLEQDFPDVQIILLEQNYRSRQNILDAASAVIRRSQTHRPRRLYSERGQGEKIYYYEARDDYEEASFVAETVANLLTSRQFPPGEIAIMYRTNAQSRLLEEAFLQMRLPYRLVGAQRFYGRREIKDLIAFLRLIHNPDDIVSLDRVINIPPRGIGDRTLLTLHTVARQAGTSPGRVLLDLARGSASTYWQAFSGRSVVLLADFGATLARWRALAATTTLPELFDRILIDLNYREYINDGSEEGLDRWENVQEFRRITREYETRTLEEFLENISLVSDQDTLTANDAPTLLTLHAAKGLEFAVVFLVGLDDGLLPHSRSFGDPESMEEERRLFYVGITRAKERLYLVRALQRGSRDYREETIPSRFLEDIPPHLLDGRSRSGRALRSVSAPSSQAQSFGTSSRSAGPEARFAAGTRVQHPLWGEGLVLQSRIQDGEEVVDVAFESVGFKRLIASIAGLVPIP
ncbi:MAG: UvrD-helicase domain-containing protein [Anaerolineales bacterium]